MDCVPSGVLGHAYVDLVVVADVEDPLSGYVLPLCHGGEDTASVLSQAEVGARVHRCDRVGTDDGVEDAVQVCLVQVGVRHRNDPHAGSGDPIEELEETSVGAQVLDVDVYFDLLEQTGRLLRPAQAQSQQFGRSRRATLQPRAARW